MKFLFDASSMVHVIKNCEEEKVLRLLNDSCVLDLTKYEVGNALWKEHVLHKAMGEKEFAEFLDLLRTILLRTKALSVEAHDLSKVAEVAEKERITFYDASYVTVAKVRNLTLLTEDTRLTRAASDHAKTASGRDLLR